MEKTYTYDPTKINDRGINQMRFELGDTFVETAETCILCDEEYKAVISKYSGKQNSFRNAKISCLKAILAKLSYEVDYKVENMSIELSQRYKHFKDMLDGLEKSSNTAFASNIFSKQLNRGGHYFYLGMQENKKAKNCGVQK